MKKKKIKCKNCDDVGYFMNPFDQAIQCDCKKKKYKKADYRGFVLHIYELTEKYSQATISMSDLKELAKKYNTPIPKQYNK